MKKIKILMIVAGIVVGGSLASATSNTCPILNDVQLIQCDPDNHGSCVNNTSLCPNITNTPKKSLGEIAGDNEVCSGNLRYDLAAAQKCADLAEKEGTALGYSIECSVDVRSEFVVQDATPVGTQTAYNPECKINGAYTADASILAGYNNDGESCTYTVFQTKSGTPIVEQCGATRNSMWYSVPCDLADSATNSAGSTAGSHTCTAGATSLFGTNNPNLWTAETLKAQGKLPGQNDLRGSNLASQSFQTTKNTSGAGANSGVYGYLQSITAIVNKMLANARTLYGSGATPPTGSTPPPGSTLPPGPIGGLPSYLYNIIIDKPSYCVGDTPRYTAVGPSNLIGNKILWSSRFNNVATNEFDSDYGYVFKNQGGTAYWSEYGNTWNASHIGAWEKTANVNGLLKGVQFNVTATCPAVPTCSPKTQTVKGLNSVWSWTATFGEKTFSAIYNWSAPGSTKTSGAGRDFGTSYATPGTYSVTVTSEGQSDTCQIVVGS